MRYLDVCSGYSAATVAFDGLGWECAGYAEIDPFAAAILAARHGATQPMRMPDPDEDGLDAKERKMRSVAIRSLPHYHWRQQIPNFGNFTTIERADVGPVDLLIGGTPCQSFSQAGKRLGLDDPRGNLTLEFLALARRLQSRWLVWENVPGFLSHDEGRTPGTFFRLLGELGYGWAYRILDAQYIRVDGREGAVPQRRRRVVVVGCLGNATAAAAVLFDRYSLRGDSRPRRRSIEDVAGPLNAGAGKRGGVQDNSGGESVVVAREVAPTIDASYGRLQGCAGQDANHGHAHLVLNRKVSFGEYVEDDVASSLLARDRMGRDGDLVVSPEVANPLRAGGPESGWQNDLDNGTFVPVPPVANTLTRDRERTAGGDGSNQTLIPVVPFDTTQVTNPHNGSNPQVGDPCHAIAAEGHPPAVAFKSAHYTRGKDGEPREVAYPLTADADKGDSDNLILDKAIGFNAVQDPDVSGDIAGPINAQSPQGQAVLSPPSAEPFVFQPRIARNDRGQPENIVPALNGADAGETSDMRPVLAQHFENGWRVRRLTPVECERLQGVPDCFTHIELKKRQRTTLDPQLRDYWLAQRPDLVPEQLLYLCADSPRYRVCGNSFATNFARWVAHGIKIVDAAVFGQVERGA